MRSRYPTVSDFSYSFGPGPVTPAVKALIWGNIAVFVGSWLVKRSSGIDVTDYLGLRPAAVLGSFRVWQVVTYMFLHGGPFHLLFNMLALWMFGVELERMWGTRYFLRYYLVCGLGAAACVILLSLTPLDPVAYLAHTIGASGAVFGILLAYGLYFPNRPIYMYFLFAIPAKYFVMIVGALTLYAAGQGSASGVSQSAHLGGLVAGYLYLKSGRVHPISEIKYRFLKWRINRMRRKFDVYSGGRADDVNRRVH
jgi:membrane associated rhomboid family serine protease